MQIGRLSASEVGDFFAADFHEFPFCFFFAVLFLSRHHLLSHCEFLDVCWYTFSRGHAPLRHRIVFILPSMYLFVRTSFRRVYWCMAPVSFMDRELRVILTIIFSCNQWFKLVRAIDSHRFSKISDLYC